MRSPLCRGWGEAWLLFPPAGSPVTLLAGALLGLLCLGVLLWPFLRRRRPPAPSALAEESGALQGRREAIYEGIRSLELEHELGQVESQEYERRLRAYRLEAAAVLQEQEALEIQVTALDEALEREIQQARTLLDGAEREATEPGGSDEEGREKGEEEERPL